MYQVEDLRDCYEIGCDGQMVEKGETGRTVQYSGTSGNSGIAVEKIYQCRKCKEIQIITDY